MNTISTERCFVFRAFPILTSETKQQLKTHYVMTGLLTLLGVTICSSLVVMWHLITQHGSFASWTPETLILAITSLVTIITSSALAVIAALSKARIEEHKALSELNLRKLEHLQQEMAKNTMLTELAQASAQQQVKTVQETVDKVVEEQKTVASHLRADTKKMS